VTLDGVAGRLLLRPGATPAVACERPAVGAALLDRLTQGRAASLLPDLLASLFSLCAQAQRRTSRRAVAAALGRPAADDPGAALENAMHVAREHLQRLALELPVLAAGVPAQPQWLRDAPVLALPPAAAGARTLADIAGALPGWLEGRLFGMPSGRWLEQWQRREGDWLADWSASQTHPVAQWLRSVQEPARAVAWPCRALTLLRDGEAGMRGLAAALRADPQFAAHPTWDGAPAETGPWTRLGHEQAPHTVWERLGARLADIARIATGVPLAQGALALAAGEGIAWTEMARGLLVHWVWFYPGAHDIETARTAHYRVLAPTEWNFHAEGGFACWLATCRDAAAVPLAAAALDPCLATTIETGLGDA
jgi:hypothetical protein